jgi:hypothetical protein
MSSDPAQRSTEGGPFVRFSQACRRMLEQENLRTGRQCARQMDAKSFACGQARGLRGQARRLEADFDSQRLDASTCFGVHGIDGEGKRQCEIRRDRQYVDEHGPIRHETKTVE